MVFQFQYNCFNVIIVLQFQWITTQNVLQLLFHNGKEVIGIQCSQEQLELNIFWFQRNGTKFTTGSGGVIKNVLKSFAILTGKHQCQHLSVSCNFIEKETLIQGFSCEFFKIFKNIFFSRTLLDNCFYFTTVTDFILAAIIYNWQLSNSYKSVSLTNPCFLVSYANCLLYYEQSTVLLAWRHLSTMLLTNIKNLNSISNTFQETHDFLVFDVPSNYLYQFKNHRETFL